MAVPKSKQSKQRSATRYAQWKIDPAPVGECTQCHEAKLAHRVCRKCGYYDGQQKIETEKAKKQ